MMNEKEMSMCVCVWVWVGELKLVVCGAHFIFSVCILVSFTFDDVTMNIEFNTVIRVVSLFAGQIKYFLLLRLCACIRVAQKRHTHILFFVITILPSNILDQITAEISSFHANLFCVYTSTHSIHKLLRNFHSSLLLLEILLITKKNRTW